MKFVVKPDFEKIANILNSYIINFYVINAVIGAIWLGQVCTISNRLNKNYNSITFYRDSKSLEILSIYYIELEQDPQMRS